ncbi:MAG: ester cyclase, partial [Candidatus Bathyarchaeota archaeon]|nr:ester cyclase [Candidatus Bathyarchaeota archaeon]
MSIEDNKTLYRRIVEEVWNSGKLELVDEFISTNCIFHTFEKDLKGPEQFRQYAEELFAVFPDIHFTIEDLIAEGNRVVSHWTLKVTQKGEFLGIPATNKNIKFQG